MQATPSSTSTIKLTTTTSTKLTPATSNLGLNSLKPTTKTIKHAASLSKKTTTSSTSTTSNSSASSSVSSSTANSEIEEISKKITEHADAIYRTWKYHGVAPTELLDIYTNAAAVQATQQGGGDIFGGSVEAAAAVTTSTEGLQQLVSQFVIKDKEQRGGIVKKATRTESTTKPTTQATTIIPTSIMPENIGSKMTQKSGGVVATAAAAAALKQQHSTPLMRATGIQKPTATSTSSTAILMKSSNKHEQGSVKKLAKTATSNLGKTAISTAAPVSAAVAPQTLDINLNLDLDFNDLQLDVNSLTQLQTQNLKKIKALLKENEKTTMTPHENEALTMQEPKKTTTTAVTKIATKNKRPNSPAKSVTEIDAPTTTAAALKLKTSKSLTKSEQPESNNHNNNHDVVVSVKKIAKNLNNNKTNNNNNNLNNNNSLTNNINSCAGEKNDVATISKLISSHDKMSNNNKQAGAKAATTTPTTTAKSTIEKLAKMNASPTTNTAASLKMASNNVGERTQQSIKVISQGISNGDQATADDVVRTAAASTASQKSPIIKANKKDKENVISNNKKINESDLKKSVKSEKINGTKNSNSNNNNSHTTAATPTLKAAIVEAAAATATVIEIAQQRANSHNNSGSSNSASITANSHTSSSSSSNTSSSTSGSSGSSNMPAPTKFKSGRAAPGAAPQDKNLNRPFLTRGSVAERVLMFEKCPDVRNSFLNIKRPDPAEAPPKSLLKAKLHANPPPPPEQRSLQQEVRSLKSVYIPRFYFPHGKPQPQIAQERMLRNILSAFDSFPNNQVTKDELPRILKLCGLPFYWRMPVMVYCQQQSNTGLVERSRFVEFWKQMNVYCHDAASRFVYILSRGQRFRSYIVPEDLVPLVQDVVDTHPGLAFLKEATEFHSRYVHTVIARIFYSVNRCWSGKITMSELKKSDLLEILSLLEEEDDINQIMAFFSYEHFYVIYCKFWELDKDHDLLINQDDLARHSDHALSTRIVERIFSGCVTRSDNKKSPNEEPKMSYTDFVWFLLSEEDKRTPTAIEYWFRCMDLDGDGVLSMYELEYFYEEQQQRMESIGIETLPFEDCLCQMLDMIKPQRRDAVTLGDLKRCKMTHVFFDTFFNLEKYLDHEQRDPFASQRDEYSSDWDRFAAQEYELLISEEND